ncbi:hypothetical protein BC477_08185 [Clavibacter michiganensis subsp. michiganensis]|uniref:Uncharacterized protein n=1 Tax=Clavibacter michiganensis subsp. michiganensis TaxID=33013 RepID=A0A251XMS4_CLAMM|nr:hypothetical protein BC477_08185 [Clavibacter michiganensis subsp. michiganensis]OUE04700.1 hypothetical protein CMMCAS07_07115 [Clavibacter michiganensis subsp. michiganensis]
MRCGRRIPFTHDGSAGHRLRPRSRAWRLGWLSLIGPVGVVASIVAAYWGLQPQLLIGVFPFSAASIATFVIGIVASGGGSATLGGTPRSGRASSGAASRWPPSGCSPPRPSCS